MRRVDAMWLGALCLCEMATMLVFLNYTAILPILQVEWGMRHGEAGLIFSAYQACYLVAVLILASLTDRMDTRTIYLGSAVWAGAASLAFPFLAHGFGSAAILRALAGLGCCAILSFTPHGPGRDERPPPPPSPTRRRQPVRSDAS